MTIIAYRGGMIAADTLVTVGDFIAGHYPKLHRVPEGIAAITGDFAEGLAIVEWLRLGRKGDSPASTDKPGARVILVPRRGAIRELAYGLEAQTVRAPFHAWGAGAPIALGAMERDATAEEAVRAAIKWCTTCGGRVQVLERNG